jgi:hypothetical protein
VHAPPPARHAWVVPFRGTFGLAHGRITKHRQDPPRPAAVDDERLSARACQGESRDSSKDLAADEYAAAARVRDGRVQNGVGDQPRSRESRRRCRQSTRGLPQLRTVVAWASRDRWLRASIAAA